MLSVWRDMKGVVMFELFPPNTIIKAAYYCDQLERLKQKLSTSRREHDKVLFLHDNARKHNAKMTQFKLLTLRWEILKLQERSGRPNFM